MEKTKCPKCKEIVKNGDDFVLGLFGRVFHKTCAYLMRDENRKGMRKPPADKMMRPSRKRTIKTK